MTSVLSSARRAVKWVKGPEEPGEASSKEEVQNTRRPRGGKATLWTESQLAHSAWNSENAERAGAGAMPKAPERPGKLRSEWRPPRSWRLEQEPLLWWPGRGQIPEQDGLATSEMTRT